MNATMIDTNDDISATSTTKYDVCIIGSGPAGLSALSAIQEPYSLDSMSATQVNNAATALTTRSGKRQGRGGPGERTRPTTRRVCVIDPNPDWTRAWNDDFSRLEIAFLRSPAMAHPDHFDANALQSYAVANGREDELFETGVVSHHGHRSFALLGQHQAGVWRLPSTALFRDFCRDVARRLDHDYVRDVATDVTRGPNDDDDDGPFTIETEGGRAIVADAVVLALGTVGRPVVPPVAREVPAHRACSWRDLHRALTKQHRNVLVVGGGLTAAQTAQYLLRRDRFVWLSSRRPLAARHFDLERDWFDKRNDRPMFHFYHEDESRRSEMIQEARGGGSVPPIYAEDLERWRRRGRLVTVSGGEPRLARVDPATGRAEIALRGGSGGGDDKDDKDDKKKRSSGDVVAFDLVVHACGVAPDCDAHPLVKRVRERWPIDAVGGFPKVTEDLEWNEDGARRLFVVGSLASLGNGPDSANLAGMRRAASVVANALDCRSWLRTKQGALSNPFESLEWDDDDTESESESDSETDEQ